MMRNLNVKFMHQQDTNTHNTNQSPFQKMEAVVPLFCHNSMPDVIEIVL
jgi:hypothetical protein